MRSITLVFVVFAAVIFLGHEYWPEPNPDPAWHFRFHRGKMPHIPTSSEATNAPLPSHGRILHPPQTN